MFNVTDLTWPGCVFASVCRQGSLKTYMMLCNLQNNIKNAYL